MKLPWWTRYGICEYHNALRREALIPEVLRRKLHTALYDPDGVRSALDAIHKDMWKEIRGLFTLSRRGTAGRGTEAARLDNLLVALRGFALAFSLFALAAVLIISDSPDALWLIPVALAIPVWHWYAWSALGRRLGDRQLAAESHIRACRFAIVPLYLICHHAWNGREPLLSSGSILLIWIGYAAALVLLLRTGDSLAFLIRLAILVFHGLVYLADCPNPAKLAVLALGNGLMATLLGFLPLLAPRGFALPGRYWFGKQAGLTLFLMLFWSALVLAAQNHSPLQATAGIGVIILFLLRCAQERLHRPATNPSWHYRGNLAASYCLSACVLLGADPAMFSFPEQWAFFQTLLRCAMCLLALSWFLWMLLSQRKVPEYDNPTFFFVGSAGLVVCFVGLMIFLLSVGWWLPVLAISICIDIHTGRKVKTLRALPRPGPVSGLAAGDDDGEKKSGEQEAAEGGSA